MTERKVEYSSVSSYTCVVLMLTEPSDGQRDRKAHNAPTTAEFRLQLADKHGGAHGSQSAQTGWRKAINLIRSDSFVFWLKRNLLSIIQCSRIHPKKFLQIWNWNALLIFILIEIEVSPFQNNIFVGLPKHISFSICMFAPSRFLIQLIILPKRERTFSLVLPSYIHGPTKLQIKINIVNEWHTCRECFSMHSTQHGNTYKYF